MTPQEKMKAKLEQSGIPFKEVSCYGSQIVITAWSDGAAKKWAMLLAKFSTVRGTVKSTAECKENKNTVLLPSVVDVWRVFARV